MHHFDADMSKHGRYRKLLVPSGGHMVEIVDAGADKLLRLPPKFDAQKRKSTRRRPRGGSIWMQPCGYISEHYARRRLGRSTCAFWQLCILASAQLSLRSCCAYAAAKRGKGFLTPQGIPEEDMATSSLKGSRDPLFKVLRSGLQELRPQACQFFLPFEAN